MATVNDLHDLMTELLVSAGTPAERLQSAFEDVEPPVVLSEMMKKGFAYMQKRALDPALTEDGAQTMLLMYASMYRQFLEESDAPRGD